MKRLVLLAFVVLALLATSCKRDPYPKNGLSKKKFTAVLYDVHLAEAIHAERYRVKPDTLTSNQIYEAVLRKHKVEEEDFLATTLYYSRHPRDYDRILNDILNKLNALNEDLNPDKPLDVAPDDGKKPKLNREIEKR